MNNQSDRIINVTYVSEWEEGLVESPARYNIDTGRVFDIEPSDDEESAYYECHLGDYMEIPGDKHNGIRYYLEEPNEDSDDYYIDSDCLRHYIVSSFAEGEPTLKAAINKLAVKMVVDNNMTYRGDAMTAMRAIIANDEVAFKSMSIKKKGGIDEIDGLSMQLEYQKILAGMTEAAEAGMAEAIKIARSFDVTEDKAKVAKPKM